MASILSKLSFKRILQIGILLFFLGIISIFGLIFAVRYGAFGKLPTNEDLRSIKNPVASEIYSADGVLLGKYYIENRSNVQYDEISEYLVKALVATEDARFFEHKGVDSRSVFRVLIKSILMGNRSSGGGSTISQQLAKNLYPRQRYFPITMPVNKIKEAITANRLEKIYDKEEILTMYLNTVSFGERAFGIGTASQRYFNKKPNDLKVEEAATLIGMLKGPSIYNPRTYPENSLKRRNTVLGRMAKKGYISQARYDDLTKRSIELDYNNVSQSAGLAPYFRHVLRDDLKKWCDEHIRVDGFKYNVFKDGLKIYTTIDSRMQVLAQEAVAEQMKALQKSFDSNKQGPKSWADTPDILADAIKQSHRFKSMKTAGISQKEIEESFYKKRNMNIFTWNGNKEVVMTPIDSIKHYISFLNAAFMALDPESGHVKAWVGGINHKYYKRDFVQTKRQVGSTFKPLVYAAAFEKGVEPCAYFSNEQQVYEKHQDWSPRNYSNEYGGAVSLETGLAKSLNTTAAELIMEVGVEPVIKSAERLGIENKLPKVPSIALGTAELTLAEMVGAYAAFANGGHQTKPQYLLRIEDANGRVLEKFDTRELKQRKKILSEETTEILTSMMQTVVNKGTARSIRSIYGLNQDIAGKTGTTQNYTDGWFIGYTPDIVAGAWVGNEEKRIHFQTGNLGSSTKTALPIWARFFQKLYKDDQYSKLGQRTFDELSYDLEEQLSCEAFLDELPDEYWLAYGRDYDEDSDGTVYEEEFEEDNNQIAQDEEDGVIGRLATYLGFKKPKQSKNDERKKKKKKKKDKKRKKQKEKERERQREREHQRNERSREQTSSRDRGSRTVPTSRDNDCQPDVLADELCYCKKIGSLNGFKKAQYQSGKIKSEGNYNNGVQTGYWKFYYSNGNMKMEGNYGSGKRNGFWKDYYESGEVKMEGNFQNCQRTGYWKYYASNGNLKSEGNYDNGVKNGTWKFYRDGRKEEVRFNCR